MKQGKDPTRRKYVVSMSVDAHNWLADMSKKSGVPISRLLDMAVLQSRERLAKQFSVEEVGSVPSATPASPAPKSLGFRT